MKPIRDFNIRPSMPERIGRLMELASGFWWEWDYDALSLFLRIDRDLWEQTDHNPVRMLGMLSQDCLEALVKDEGFLAQYDRICAVWDAYLKAPTWMEGHTDLPDGFRIAYFSFEFGLSECVPIYSGGLGVLSGDHVKASSDLGLPLTGVGMLYQQGYFRQYLNVDGWQGERYPDNDFYNMPVVLERDEKGEPRLVKVDFPDGPCFAQIWRIRVGRTSLVMLDTNIAANENSGFRDVTDQLYGGHSENRIRQEILLGVGGLRALDALGLRPTVCHLNEGHSAFLALERIRVKMEENGLGFEQAVEAVRAGNVFTTHTPVPAGNEVFAPALVERYLSALFGAGGGETGRMPLAKMMAFGLVQGGAGGQGDGFGMTPLAIRTSSSANAVSRLHGEVTREMWKGLWPGTPVEEIPICSVTNGVHVPSWVSHDMADLFERYLGPDWRRDGAGERLWELIRRIPHEELWRTHERRRERLVGFARRRLRGALQKRRASPQEMAAADEVLNPEALTVAFARRFATYKRGALLLRDLDRLRRLISDERRPIQFIFSGKAHPHDNPGKEVIRQIAHVARQSEFRHHVIFLEDYDLSTARYLVQGADVWLNTPRRPLEASGTSGMKAAANGVLNASILDGWYDEAHREFPGIGWAIGAGEVYEDHDYQDQVECDALYNILESEVMPLFWDRSRDNLPRQWVERMKEAMVVSCSRFNTNRMTREYSERLYFPAARRSARLAENDYQGARRLAGWFEQVRREWGRVKIERVESGDEPEFGIGERMSARARVRLGKLKPEDVRVEVYFGEIDPTGEIRDARCVELAYEGPAREGDRPEGAPTPGVHWFAGAIEASASGHFGFSARVLPCHKDLATPFVPGMIVWAEPPEKGA